MQLLSGNPAIQITGWRPESPLVGTGSVKEPSRRRKRIAGHSTNLDVWNFALYRRIGEAMAVDTGIGWTT